MVSELNKEQANFGKQFTLNDRYLVWVCPKGVLSEDFVVRQNRKKGGNTFASVPSKKNLFLRERFFCLPKNKGLN